MSPYHRLDEEIKKMCSSGNEYSSTIGFSSLGNYKMSSTNTKVFFWFGRLKIQIKFLQYDNPFIKFPSDYPSYQNKPKRIEINLYSSGSQQNIMTESQKNINDC